MIAEHGAVIALALALATGCAEQLHYLQRGVAGGTPVGVFWPPPRPTALWTTEAHASTLGAARDHVDRVLRDAGYDGARWFPIGAGYAHGFAAITRVEAIDDDGAPRRDGRWLALYREPASPTWIATAAEPRLPVGGRYRVILVAFTDLPIGPTHRAPRWDAETILEAPDFTPAPLPRDLTVPPRYRVGVYVYEYEGAARDEVAGRFLERDADRSAAAQIERSGLASLGAP